jgi:hypothetical protein
LKKVKKIKKLYFFQKKKKGKRKKNYDSHPLGHLGDGWAPEGAIYLNRT